MPPARAAVAEAAHWQRRMEAQPAGSDFLVGSNSLPGIAFFMALLVAERIGAPLTADLPRIVAWRRRVTARDAARRVDLPIAAYLRAQGCPVPAFVAPGPG